MPMSKTPQSSAGSREQPGSSPPSFVAEVAVRAFVVEKALLTAAGVLQLAERAAKAGGAVHVEAVLPESALLGAALAEFVAAGAALKRGLVAEPLVAHAADALAEAALAKHTAIGGVAARDGVQRSAKTTIKHMSHSVLQPLLTISSPTVHALECSSHSGLQHPTHTFSAEQAFPMVVVKKHAVAASSYSSLARAVAGMAAPFSSESSLAKALRMAGSLAGASTTQASCAGGASFSTPVRSIPLRWQQQPWQQPWQLAAALAAFGSSRSLDN